MSNLYDKIEAILYFSIVGGFFSIILGSIALLLYFFLI